MLEKFNLITVIFLPPNITPHRQPLDKNIILNLKKLHSKVMFQRCFKVIPDSELAFRKFSKKCLNIVICVNVVEMVKQEVIFRTMNTDWKMREILKSLSYLLMKIRIWCIHLLFLGSPWIKEGSGGDVEN